MAWTDRLWTRQRPYLHGPMIVRRWDLEYRGTPGLRTAADLPLSVQLWCALLDAGPTLALDVGASYGAFTLAGRYLRGSRCLAFEPHPQVVRCLRQSVREHPDAERITVYAAAVSDVTAPGWLQIDTLKSGCSSLHAHPRRRGPLTRQAIARLRLDQAVVRRPGEACLLKSDTEGHEVQVLLGARGLLGAGGDP